MESLRVSRSYSDSKPRVSIERRCPSPQKGDDRDAVVVAAQGFLGVDHVSTTRGFNSSIVFGFRSWMSLSLVTATSASLEAWRYEVEEAIGSCLNLWVKMVPDFESETLVMNLSRSPKKDEVVVLQDWDWKEVWPSAGSHNEETGSTWKVAATRGQGLIRQAPTVPASASEMRPSKVGLKLDWALAPVFGLENDVGWAWEWQV